MSLAVFPNAIRGFRRRPFFKNPEFATIVQQSSSFVSTRIAQAQNPVWHWQLLYEYIKNQDPQRIYNGFTDYQILQGFYMARNGQFDDFLFSDPTDNSVTLGPLQLFQDSTSGNWYSPIQRNFGGQFDEDIIDLASGISVFENGSPSTTGYSLNSGGLTISSASWSGMYLAWASEPTAPITATFNFYFRARFEMDESEFEEWINGIWTSGGSGSSKGDVLKLEGVTFPLGGSSGTTGGAPAIPAPAQNFPSGATQMVILYPTTVVGTNTGWGTAVGSPGVQATGNLFINSVSLGYTSPLLTFSGYTLPPYIPQSELKAIYTYGAGSTELNNGYAFFLRQDAYSGSTPLATGVAVGGAALIYNSSSAPTANFSLINQKSYTVASLSDSWNPPTIIGFSPCLVVYY